MLKYKYKIKNPEREKQMKNFFENKETKKINKKKIAITILIILVLIAVITLTIIYIKNEQFREWFDTSILQKEVDQNKLAIIELKEEDNPQIYAFNQNIGVLSKNKLKLYNNTGKEQANLTVEISNPIYSSNGRYLAIAENKGQKIYHITDNNITWEKTVEGNISQIQVNPNGYVAVIIVGTTNKTMITLYDDKGESLFNTYLSTSRVSDVTISKDNKYLAMAEIDTTGIVIESKIEVIDIEKVKTDAENSKVATYTFDNNELITNIEYQNKDQLICMTKDKIMQISLEGNKEEIHNNEKTKTTFQTIQLNNNVATIEEQTSNLFTADSIVTIINTENKNQITYTANAVTKDIYTYNDIIALNLGTEIEFINTGGWLVKRYKAEQEITDVTLSDNIAGIIYRDKIEIIDL